MIRKESFPVITGELFSFFAQNKNGSKTTSFLDDDYLLGVIQHDKENEKRRRHKAKRQAQAETENIRFCKRTEWISLDNDGQSLTGWLFNLELEMFSDGGCIIIGVVSKI